MDLPSTVNAPRLVVIGEQRYRACALTIADIGEFMAFLEDRLGYDPDTGLVDLQSEVAQAAIVTTECRALVVHLALHRCHPELTRDQAIRLVERMGEDTYRRLDDIAWRRRPTWQPSGAGQGPSEVNWGKMFAEMANPDYGTRGPDPASFLVYGSMTIDQFECFRARGQLDDALYGGQSLSAADVQAMVDAANKARDASEEDVPRDD